MIRKYKPDHVVFSEKHGYNASLLPYATSFGAAVIKADDLGGWKNLGINNSTKSLKVDSGN